MPVSSIASTALIPVVPQRGDVGRPVREQERTGSEENRAAQPPENHQVDRESLGLLAQQRVPTETRANTPDFRLQSRSDQESLNFTAQKALKAFADNTPTPEQRLGIELAGIDTYV